MDEFTSVVDRQVAQIGAHAIQKYVRKHGRQFVAVSCHYDIGGDRRSWPAELELECHKGDHDGHTDVYGRMAWDRWAPTLTGRCNSVSNGRYGHPCQDRAISLREAASLQTFGDAYVFCGTRQHIARQIGNAVPVKFGEILGGHLLRLRNSKAGQVA